MMTYQADPNNDGYVRMAGAMTLDRYKALKYDEQPPQGNYFWAFDRNQLATGYMRLKESGAVSEPKQLLNAGGGLFGTRQALDNLYMWEIKRGARIADECDPQEVYLYEYNNHESFISWDGDLEPIKIIINIWGYEVAQNIDRLSATKTIEQIINEYYLKSKRN